MIPRKNNLVGFWKLNGAKDSSGNTLDFSGNGNSGTITGTEAYETNQFGKKSQLFDDATSIEASSNLGLCGNRDWTVAFNMNLDFPLTNNVRSFLGVYDSVNDQRSWSMQLRGPDAPIVGDILSIITSDDGASIQSYWASTLNVSREKVEEGAHVVVRVRDGRYMTIFVNGVAETIEVDLVLFDSNAVFRVYNAEGIINNVMIWDTALSPTEVKQVYLEAQLPPMESGLEKPIAQEQPLIREGLVGAWGFKGSRQTANDLSDSGNDGTIKGDTIIDSNSRFVFDGTGDYVTTSKDLTNGLSEVTIGVWMKTDYIEVNNALAGTFNGIGSAFNGAYLAGDAINSLSFGVDTALNENFRTSSDFDFNDNEWHFVVGVYDGSSSKLYIDGVLNNSRTGISGTIDSSPRDFAIGASSNNTNHFSGSIGETQIFDRALTEDEIKLIYNKSVPDDSLVFSTKDGIKDLSGKNTITNNGVVVGKEMVFDGASYIGTNYKIPVDQQALTFVAVCENESIGSTNPIISSYPVHYFRFTSTGTFQFANYNADTTITSAISSVLNMNQKYHVVGTLDKSTGEHKLYVNGKLVATDTYAGGNFRTLNNINIGANTGDLLYLDGKIYNVKIFNEAKSAGWIAEDYKKSIIKW